MTSMFTTSMRIVETITTPVGSVVPFNICHSRPELHSDESHTEEEVGKSCREKYKATTWRLLCSSFWL